MNIDINELKNIKELLDSLQEDDVLYIDENSKTKYAIMPIDTYDKVSDLLAVLDDVNPVDSKVKVVGDNPELTYEEYERIKALIMDAVEKTFKPKAEKLN